MNRGRHHRHQIDEIVKLAKQYGAHYPEAWKNNISYENLINLINTQKKECGFNDLHVFEIDFSSSNITKGGFNWGRTKEGFCFWHKVLERLYFSILKYKSKPNQKILIINLK